MQGREVTPEATRHDAGDVFDIVIVGGGAAATLVAFQLLRGEAPYPRVALVEPRPAIARGVAYSTTRPEHLLNVIASRMTVLPEDPGHFVRHLEAVGTPGTGAVGDRFAPRRAFAGYLDATLASAPGRDALSVLQDAVVDVLPVAAGGLRTMVLASGRQLSSREVVLAAGNEGRGLPLPAAAIQGAPQVVEAWDYDGVAAIAPDRDVCIVGSGLSMVDAAITRIAQGHTGRITVVSRHGLLPLPHAAPGDQHASIDADALQGTGIRGRLRLLRAWAREAEAHGHPWQWTLDAVRHHVQDLWRHTDARERGRFLRHAVRYWDIHRHRIAPEVAAQLDACIADGRMQVRAGRLRTIAGHADGTADVTFVPRDGNGPVVLPAQVVINATGIETTLARSRRPLMRALQARGAVQAGPLGIGIAADAGGAVLGADGHADIGLHVLGAARIGDLWESVAIPELRGQAAELARGILARWRARA